MFTSKYWKKFCQNKRAFYSFWIFIIIYGISLVAEFVANDRPLLIHYKNHFYTPIIHDYPETEFGGTLQTSADFKDPFLKASIEKDGWIIWAPIPYGIQTINYERVALAPPHFQNWLGTDDQGRDVLTRLIYGFRTSVSFSLTLTILTSFLGLFFGAIQGYFGGIVDLIGQRLVEIWNGLPVLYLLIILSSLVEPHLIWLLLILIPFSWMSLSVLIRAEFLKMRATDYVRSAEILGVPPFRIIRHHILPNATIAMLTYLPFLLNQAIVTLTALDFLGFGLPPGSASLGELITQGKNHVHAPWLGITAFLTLAILLSLITFIGEGIRDALNPKK